MTFQRWMYLFMGLGALGLCGIAGYFTWSSFRSKRLVKISEESLEHVEDLIPVVIIGSGPAGLSAALYAARMNMPTVLFKGTMAGGQLMGTGYVENWPPIGAKLGPEIMKDFEKHVEHFGAQLAAESITKVDFNTYPFTLWTDEGTEIRALAVIIATGSLPRKLGVEGESEYWGKGVSTCAVCDAPFYKDKTVVVIGGGDSAAEEAMELASVSKKVNLLVRGDAMRASAIMQNRLKDYPNIEIKYNTKVAKINGDGKQLTHLDIVTNGKPSEMPIDGLFLGIGHDPNSTLFKDYLTLNKRGYIHLKTRSQMTNIPGIFAAGDVADFKYRQAGVASGNGIKAALDTVGFLRERGVNDQLISALDSQFYIVEDKTLVADLPMITTIAEFEEEIKGEKRPVVIDFYAAYCPSCMQMLPTVEAVAAKLQDDIKFIKSDVSINKELVTKFGVNQIPTMVVLKDGKVIAETHTVMDKRNMMQFFQKFLRENDHSKGNNTP